MYEIKELYPKLKVSVKLVSGDNIGAISVGVAKAGADVIQISGGDGGTGAASLLSMKHAGLPLEIGLLEVHRALVDNNMRERVALRADGGFLTGKDIIIASALGADEFDFGKLLLVGEGCIMARICEKNTCPTGIATHAPKFKAFYKGEPSKVVRLLDCLALEVREILASMGVARLSELTGRNHFLEANRKHTEIIEKRSIKLDHFTHDYGVTTHSSKFDFNDSAGLNQRIVDNLKTTEDFKIFNYDRAIPATLAGLYALKKIKLVEIDLPEKAKLKFIGSAGQGFAVFNVEQIEIRLEGEANDSVAKGMSGGKVTITPPDIPAPTFPFVSPRIQINPPDIYSQA